MAAPEGAPLPGGWRARMVLPCGSQARMIPPLATGEVTTRQFLPWRGFKSGERHSSRPVPNSWPVT